MSNKTENTKTENGPKPVAIASLNFKAEVLESKLPVLVEFWTGWSQPCQISASVLREVAHDLAGKIKVVKVNADDSLELSLWCEIQSIPTLIYFVEGKPCFRIVGTASKEAILAKLKALSDVEETVTSAKGASGGGRQPGKEN
jgi:thioredoxin 1